MTVAARPVPPRSDEAPICVLVDYDGTISRVDIGDELLRRFVDDPAVAVKEADYDAGRVGSRELLRWYMDILPRDADRLRAAAGSIPQDESLPAFVRVARSCGVIVEVVSDGLGFYVASNLARLGLGDLAVATNENRIATGGAGMAFPYGHPRCFVCGTCKRERVRAHQAAGRAVVFVGDGMSDRFAAFHADVVFAKGSLAGVCDREGWPYEAWDRFDELTEWLSASLEDGALPRTAAELQVWQGIHRPAAAWRATASGRPGFICGPEAWGPDRAVPVPSVDRSAAGP